MERGMFQMRQDIMSRSKTALSVRASSGEWIKKSANFYISLLKHFYHVCMLCEACMCKLWFNLGICYCCKHKKCMVTWTIKCLVWAQESSSSTAHQEERGGKHLTTNIQIIAWCWMSSISLFTCLIEFLQRCQDSIKQHIQPPWG